MQEAESAKGDINFSINELDEKRGKLEPMVGGIREAMEALHTKLAHYKAEKETIDEFADGE